MKYRTCYTVLAGICLLTILTAKAGADLPPQPPLQFSEAAPGTYQAAWQGVTNRTYFLQFSLDLQTWHYAPLIEYGDEAHSTGMASTSEKFFIRLVYGDFPGISSLAAASSADFDNDRLPNLFEVTFGYDPLSSKSTSSGFDGFLDPDGDGLDNAGEALAGTDPFMMDSDGDGYGDNLEVLHGGDLAAYLASGNASDAFEVFTESD